MPELERLAVVCHQYPPRALGGLAEYAERSLRELRRQRPDLELTLYTMNHPGRHPGVSLHDGVTVVRPGIPGWLRRLVPAEGSGASVLGQAAFALALALFNLAVFLRLRRVRSRGLVVAIHDWQSTPVGIGTAWLLRSPVVYHVHNTEQTMTPRPDVADPLGVIGVCQRLMSRLAALVVVPTSEMKTLLVRHGWNPDRIRVVPHGHEDDPGSPSVAIGDRDRDRAAIRSAVLADVGFPADSWLLVFVGRLSPVKGIHTLLRALPAIARRHPAVRLLVLGVGVAGTGQDEGVDRLVTELGVGGLTHVYHRYLPREQVRRHYQAADLCVFPSTYEPFGLVAVEAMALGVPVVLGPGFSASIAADGDHRAAYQVREDTPEALSRLVVSLLDQPAALRAVAKRGQAHVLHTFTWSASVHSTLATYQEAVNDRPGAGRRGALVPGNRAARHGG